MNLQIRINKTFLKELAVLPSKQRKTIEQFVFREIIQYKPTLTFPT